MTIPNEVNHGAFMQSQNANRDQAINHKRGHSFEPKSKVSQQPMFG